MGVGTIGGWWHRHAAARARGVVPDRHESTGLAQHGRAGRAAANASRPDRRACERSAGRVHCGRAGAIPKRRGTRVFSSAGRQYREPVLVLFEDAVRSACGSASAASGPFYCPADQKVYLDLSFFRELDRRFGAPGDFAQAYVVAHEVGHHVQNLLGINRQVQEAQQGGGRAGANALSVQLELQADCFAGVWGHHANKKQLLDAGRRRRRTERRRGDRRRSPDQGPRVARELHARHVANSARSGCARACRRATSTAAIRSGRRRSRSSQLDLRPSLLPDLYSPIGREKQLVSLLHAKRRVELRNISDRAVGAIHLRRMHVGQHLLAQRLVALLRLPRLRPSHVEALIGGECRRSSARPCP